MAKHPYQTISPQAHWRTAVQDIPAGQIDPVGDFKFKLERSSKVATAGSCFAQHIARHLAKSGFNYYVVEQGHPVGSKKIQEKFNYGIFSGRYGNIYTSKQLLQLFDRAFGHFQPADQYWLDEAGNYIDPFRPAVQPHGFSTLDGLLADREKHLAAVREMFLTLDYFVFTLGLTECWQSTVDGAAYPVCPGVAGGVFSEEKYRFTNLSVADTLADLRSFRDKLHQVNPNARMILTVSPVPLMATMEPRHVLVSTTASKAILRVAADEMERAFDNVAYFPSYEIITSAFARGAYLGPDLRSVTETGVEHVMRLFLRHATATATGLPAPAADEPANDFSAKAKDIVDVICEENLLQKAG
ncbi:MAG: GSCFA domain-containing protein [Burkholderiaceae bacterium]|nr:GSCFA domain-containing protein [Burkholderiaceae bacterium]